MRRPASILLACLATTTAFADSGEHSRFLGTWGTSKQCNHDPIKPGGTVLATPFEIRADWLRHGTLWCQLDWGPVEQRDSGYFTGANARCGEDAVRDYFLGMTLTGDALTLRWQPFLANGPLARCPVS